MTAAVRQVDRWLNPLTVLGTGCETVTAPRVIAGVAQTNAKGIEGGFQVWPFKGARPGRTVGGSSLSAVWIKGNPVKVPEARNLGARVAMPMAPGSKRGE